MAETFCLLTLTVHVCIEVQLSDIIRLSCLDPDALPNAAAGRVEYVGLVQCLLANRNHIVIAVCWVMHKHEPVDCPDRLAVKDYR